MTPVMRLRGRVSAATLPRLPPEDSAPELLEQFELLWAKRHQVKAPSGDGKALGVTCSKLLYPRFQLSGLWNVLDAASNFSQPFIVATLVRDLRLADPATLGFDYGLVVLLTLSTFLSAAAIQQVLWNGARVGLRAKIALSAAVYSKTLALGNSALLKTSAGQATNIVATDVQRLEMSYTMFHMLWLAPTNIVILGVILGVHLVGVACLPAMGFLVFLFGLQKIAASRLARLRSVIAKRTDTRVKCMHDVLAGCESLKVTASEDALARRVRALRAREESIIWRSLAMLSCMEAFIFFAPGVATFLVLITHASIHADSPEKRLQIEEAYAVLGFVNVLVKTFNTFPRAAKGFDEARISFRRIERFLLLPEVKSAANEAQAAAGAQFQLNCGTGDGEEATMVSIRGACATWGGAGKGADEQAADGATPSTPTTPDVDTKLDDARLASVGLALASDAANGDDAVSPFGLSDIELTARRGELVLLLGEVGCGKSSFLQMVLGEMELTAGCMTVRREDGVGYVPQVSWILNATVRENILLGRPLDEAWYREVVSACALLPDLASFAEGDETEIGERGVTVSGGQKARISLARALYGKPALLLLDDPLSAVDQHVAQTLVREALIGLARKRLKSAVLLVSHQLQFAEELADVCVVLSRGRIFAAGHPSSAAIAELLRSSQAGATETAEAAGEVGAPAEYEVEATKASVDALAAHDGEVAPTVVCGGSAMAAIFNGNGAMGASDDLERVTKSAVAPRESSLPGKAAALKSEAGKVTGSAVPPAMIAVSNLEMGRGNSRGEALRFYLRKLTFRGCVAIFFTFLGLGVCRALADWQLGRWILSGQQLSGSFLYASLVAGTVLFGCSYALAFSQVVGAASRIHHVVLARVLRAPKAFFDTTPLGMLVNLFSKDLDTLDEMLPVSLTGLAKCITIVSTAVIVSAVAAPAALVCLPIVVVTFRKLTRFFQLSATQLKRLDKATSGPLFSLYAETLGGVGVIRAFGLQPAFRVLLLRRLDVNHAAHFLWLASNRWFAARLDWLTGLIVLVVGMSVLLLRDVLDPVLAALALTYILQMTSLFQWGFRNWAECQNHFVSVERALSYSRAPQEPAAEIAKVDSELRAQGWPARGAVRFEGVQMRYRPELPLVLTSVDFALPAGVKAAVVGRSGAGKSSLSVALLRLAPLDAGRITIDGVDVSTLGLSMLRRAVTLIPQDAMMFSGSLRSNLDPFGEHTDAALEAALGEIDFGRLASGGGGGGGSDGGGGGGGGVDGGGGEANGKPAGDGARCGVDLEMEIAEGGGNLSAGMRQLVMLARAMLRRSQLLLMDEATANIDYATDAVIQRVVREQFRSSTILTIAHRLDTIIDYDTVLLMADGRVAESGRPADLLASDQSKFHALVARGGDAVVTRLKAAAATSPTRAST